jgi:hypothetical protein
LLHCKIEQANRFSRIARAREGEGKQREGAGGPDLVGIGGGSQRRLQACVKKFGGLRRFSREKRKGGEGGVPGLFIAAQFLAGGGRVARGRDDER